jgi:hypothetical protein
MRNPAISIIRGDTWLQQFWWHQESETGPALDLSGCRARLQLREFVTDALLLDIGDEPSETGVLEIDGLAGRVDLRVSAAATALFPVGLHSFDLEMRYADGTVMSTETVYLNVIKDQTHVG